MERRFEASAVSGVLAGLLLACYGSAPTEPPPVPTISAISPASAARGGPPFTLTVTGSGFFPSSVVQWNGHGRPTTLTSANTLTAEISANDILAAGPDLVTVVNGASSAASFSNGLTFTVPCSVILTVGPASGQTRARLGIYYFDGWAGGPDSYHLVQLVNSPYQDREPLTGWRDDNTCAVEQQLVWAHNFGINFFVFDWYFNATVVDRTEDLNSAIKITRALPDRHGMQYAIMYVNWPPFIVSLGDWRSAVNEWTGYFTDSAYVRVNGKPVLFVYDPVGMHNEFGSTTAVANAFTALRSAAQARGLPGVYIVAEFRVWAGSAGQDSLYPDYSWTAAEGYDAFSMYGYSAAWPQGMNAGILPFSINADAAKWIWSQAALKSPLPFIADPMSGWDPRPCALAGDGACPWAPQTVTWFKRTPQEVASLVSNAITWADTNTRVRPEPSPAAPMVVIEAWNELLEGSYMVPTVGDGTSYGDALAAMLTSTPAPPSVRARSAWARVEHR